MVVPSGDTRRLGADADADSGSDLDSALLLRVILLSRCEYCCFVSSYLFTTHQGGYRIRMQRKLGGKGFPVAAVVVVVAVADAVLVVCNNVLWLRNRYYNECWYCRKSNPYRIDCT